MSSNALGGSLRWWLLVVLGLVLASAAQAGEITLFEHAGYGGAQLTLRGPARDISGTGFNDKASSIVVDSGRWQVCTDADFRGICAVFARGEYPRLDGYLNDRISSAREIDGEGDGHGDIRSGYGRGTIELYDDRGFRGRVLHLDGDMPVLARAGFNDRAQSVVVVDGTWELCVDVDFRGPCRTYGPGRYPDLGYGMDEQVSSARLLRPQTLAPIVLAPGVQVSASPPPARAVLFAERGLRGASLALAGSIASLDRAGFDDAASSLYVESGNWVACRDTYFRGDCRSFGPGRYDDLGSVGLDRAISSIRPGYDGPPPPPTARPPVDAPAVELYSEVDFNGERVRIDRDVVDLSRLGFNDRAASLLVDSGAWEICTDSRYSGQCSVFRPGRYSNLGGLTRQASSLRRVR